jgi:hypothetical protein
MSRFSAETISSATSGSKASGASSRSSSDMKIFP